MCINCVDFLIFDFEHVHSTLNGCRLKTKKTVKTCNSLGGEKKFKLKRKEKELTIGKRREGTKEKRKGN